MDLPLVLETREMVDSGLPSKKQEIEVLLHQPYGTILQNAHLGTNLDVHGSNPILVRTAIIATLKQVEDIYNVSCEVDNDGNANVSFFYNGTKASMVIAMGEENAGL